MAGQKGRDFLIKIGDGGGTEVFTSIGAARTVGMSLSNNPVDDTTMDSVGIQTMIADAGVQSMTLSLDGLFKDAAVEEKIREAAEARTAHNYEIAYPNGDVYMAEFVIQDYNRGGSHDGLETFSMTLVRNGAGTFTAA